VPRARWTAEPLRESAHREIAAIHLAEGDTAQALRHFSAYRRRLHRELGLSPSPGFRRLLASPEFRRLLAPCPGHRAVGGV